MAKSFPSHYLLHLMVRARKLATAESQDSGYAMVIVSIVTLMMFSLMAAYLTITNITKSSTNAYVEGNSTFYAAESGLNKRADAVRRKFVNYAVPEGMSPGQVAGTIAGIENMSFCLDSDTTNEGTDDFACQSQVLNYQQALDAQVSKGALTEKSGNVQYTAYTFTSDRTNYSNLALKIPQVVPIPSGQAFAGLNAQEYRYTIYSTATSKQAGQMDARATTILEMTFKNRVIPLFQFAAFYDDDLEMNSTSQMNINGRIHTNGNLYAQPTPYDSEATTTRLLSPVTVAGRIYNQVEAMTLDRFGFTKVLLTGNPNDPDAASNTYAFFPKVRQDTPLSSTQIATLQGKVLDGNTGATRLVTPLPGFIRKRDPSGNIGDYYGRADLRLEMFPKRPTGSLAFDFTAIKAGGTTGGSCAGMDISSGRQGTDDLKCSKLTEGQLRSLQQPVMVKLKTAAERTRFATAPSYCPTTAVLDDAAATSTSRATLRALQVAIAAQNKPVMMSELSLPLKNSAGMKKIIDKLITSIDKNQSPIQIAAANGGCFMPPPIQTITGGGPTNDNYNWKSGYYDRREQRWIGMLQTNIESLTVWNRDGLYVDRDNTFGTNDTANEDEAKLAFNSGNASATYDTDGLLFVRAAAKTTAPVGSLQNLGFGSADTTEGGLVLYATVNDNLGDGTTIPVGADNLRTYPGGNKRMSPYGFAINGGADLAGAFTVATDQGIYVQGNYNNFGGNSARQPASIVGDTITVLSQSCIDGDERIKCGTTSGQNPAAETTINAAFLSYTGRSTGNLGTTTAGGTKSYSGGLNNYMRMVENWGGINFNYTGSFVSLGTPQEFSGQYLSGNSDADGGYYIIPTRNFAYDANFDRFDLLPPLTPKVVYLQQETFKRSY